MLLKLLNIPVNKEITNGCTMLREDGSAFAYDTGISYPDNSLNKSKVCEPLLVIYSYNTMVIIGRPSPKALKWLKPGDSIKLADCELWQFMDDETPVIAAPKHVSDGVLSGNIDINTRETKDTVRYFWMVKCPVCRDLH